MPTIDACRFHSQFHGLEATPYPSAMPFAAELALPYPIGREMGDEIVFTAYSCLHCRWAGPEEADLELSDRLSADGGLQ